MEIPATMTSKGQITIPVEVRKALGLQPGDRLIFRVAGDRVVAHPERDVDESPRTEIRKVPDFFDLGGSMTIPPDIDPADWATLEQGAWAAAVRKDE